MITDFVIFRIWISLLIVLLAAAAASCDRAAPATGDAVPRQTDTRSASTTTSARVVKPQTRTSAPAITRAADEQPQHERLYGTWVARDVDTKLGEVKIQLTFKQDGPVKILAWSDLPFVGQVRNKQAPYEAHGNTISSDAIRGGTSVNYRFDGGDLIIEYQDGKTVRLKRQS